MTFGKPVRRTSLIAQVTDQLRARSCPAAGRPAADSDRAGTRRADRDRAQHGPRGGPGARARGHARTTSGFGHLRDHHQRPRRDARQVLRGRARAGHPRAASGPRRHRGRPRRPAPRRHRHRHPARSARATNCSGRPWAAADTTAAVAADLALHRAIVAASHNEVYLEFYDSLLPAIEQTIRPPPPRGRELHDRARRARASRHRRRQRARGDRGAPVPHRAPGPTHLSCQSINRTRSAVRARPGAPRASTAGAARGPPAGT